MPDFSKSAGAKLFCHACGKRIHPDSRFCRHCGTRVAAPSSGSPPESPAGRPPTTGPGDVHHDPNCEVEVWQGRPAWRAFSGRWVVWAIVSIILLSLVSRYGGDGSLMSGMWLLVGSAAVSLLVRDALIVYGRRYHLTTQRLFVHRGILHRVTDQTELIRVDDVRQSQTVLDRVLGTGSLQIFSTDETDEAVTLRSIRDPMFVAEQIRLHTRGVRSKGAIAVERI